MNDKQDGGPAFARSGIPTNWAEGHHAQHGMSLRDYFAAHALASMTTAPDYSKGPCNAVMAERAYVIADAMLKARQPTP